MYKRTKINKRERERERNKRRERCMYVMKFIQKKFGHIIYKNEQKYNFTYKY